VLWQNNEFYNETRSPRTISVGNLNKRKIPLTYHIQLAFSPLDIFHKYGFPNTQDQNLKQAWETKQVSCKWKALRGFAMGNPMGLKAGMNMGQQFSKLTTYSN